MRNPFEEPEAFFTHGEPCENCGSPCDAGTRTWIEGFDFWACDQCAEEAAIVIFAESNCPTLYDAIMRSKHVSEVQQAYQEHQRSCPHCLKLVRKIERESLSIDRERAA